MRPLPLLLVLALAAVLSTSPADAQNVPPCRDDVRDLMQNQLEPIRITSDAELEFPFNLQNGACRHDEQDFAIVGWDVAPGTGGEPTIAISNTTSSLRLEALDVAQGASGIALRITDASNILVQGLRLPDARIVIERSHGIVLRDVQAAKVEIDGSEVLVSGGRFQGLQANSSYVETYGTVFDGAAVNLDDAVAFFVGASFVGPGSPAIQGSGNVLFFGSTWRGFTGHCIAPTGGTWELWNVEVECGGVSGTPARLHVHRSQFLGGDVPLLDVADADVVVQDSLLERGSHAVRLDGTATLRMTDSRLLDQRVAALSIGSTARSVEVARSSFEGTTGVLVEARGNIPAQPPPLDFVDNKVDTLGDGFAGPTQGPAAGRRVDELFEVRLALDPPQPGINIMGQPGLGGNAWLRAGLFDGDGDGFAQHVHVPQGLVDGDPLAIVPPNFAPTITGFNVTPDPRLPDLVIMPDSTFMFDAQGGDPDENGTALVAFSWQLGDTVVEQADGEIAAPAPGDHELVLRLSDAYGAFDERRFPLTVDVPNQAPTFSTPPERVSCAGEAWEEGIAFVDEPVCFAAVAVDPDAGSADRLDLLYVDLGGTGSISAGDLRVTAAAQPSLGQGPALGTSDIGLPLQAVPGGLGSSPHGWLLDLGCDGSVDPGDIRLEPVAPGAGWPAAALPAGTRVKGTDGDAGAPVVGCAPPRVLHAAAIALLDLDGDGHVSVGDLLLPTGQRVDPVHPALGAAGADGPSLGLLDRNGLAQMVWTAQAHNVVLPPVHGPAATFTFTQTGPATVTAVVSDLGDPPGAAFTELELRVLNRDPPSVDVRIEPPLPRTVEGGELVVRALRDVPFELRDASTPPDGGRIESRTWHLPEGPVTGDLPLQLGDLGTFELTYTVRADNGMSSTLPIRIEVQPAAPLATIAVSPVAFDIDVPVTFSATGSTDTGGLLVPLPAPRVLDVEDSFGPGEDLVVIDADDSHTLTAGDVALSTVDIVFPSREVVGAQDADLQAPLVDTGAHACIVDADGSQGPSAGDGVYLQQGCDAVRPGAMRLIDAQGILFQDTVGPGDGDVGQPLMGLPAQLVQADGLWYIHWGPGDDLAPGDVALMGFDAPMLAEDDGRLGPFEQSTPLRDALSATGRYQDVDGDGEVGEGDIRMLPQRLRLSYLQPFEGGVGEGRSLDESARSVCYHDANGDGRFGRGPTGAMEPVYFAAACTGVSAGDVGWSRDPLGIPRPPGLSVAPQDADVGLLLAPLSAALGAAQQATYIDLDGDGHVSAFDLRLTDASGNHPPGTHVLEPSAPDLGMGGLSLQWRCSHGCRSDPFLGQQAAHRPLVHFTTSGPKTIELRATNDQGTTTTALLNVIVANLPPTPMFTQNPAAPTDIEAVTFDASGTNDRDGAPDGSGLTYTWLFDDGAPNQQGPVATRIFDEPGTYEVTLQVRDADPITPKTATLVRTVTVRNVPPVPAFTVEPTVPLSQAPVVFDGSASADLDGEVVAWAWEWTYGGTVRTATGPVVQQTFARAGLVEFRLTVTDDRGDTAELGGTVAIQNRPPVAVATADKTADLPPATVRFSSTGSADPEGTVLTYLWDFGDGTTSTSSQPTHVFAQRGLYQVRLTVRDEDGATSSTTLPFRVLNQPPIATMQIPSELPAGEMLEFSAIASDPEGDPVTFRWTFSGPEPVASKTGEKISVQFPRWGTYSVTLNATDPSGDGSTTQRSFRVTSERPTVALTADRTTVDVGRPVTFAGTATDPDGITSHFLDLGDGTTAFAAQLTHTYREPGTYTVTYRATDSSQASGSAKLEIVVVNPRPVVRTISVAPGNASTGDLLLFTADVTDDAVGRLTYQWDFKDGVTSSLAAPTHIYRVSGTFNVELRVTDAFGATTTSHAAVTVTPRGGADPGGPDTVDDADGPAGATRLDKGAPGAGAWAILALLAVAQAARRR